MRAQLHKYRIEGLVIKRVNINEADKLITLITRYKGKITCLAKGVRKIISRKAPHLELFTLVKLSISMGKSLNYITEAETISSFSSIRSNLEKIAWAYKIIEQTDRLVSEGLESRVIFDMLVSVMTRFDQIENLTLRNAVDEYSLNLLWELGYLPKDTQMSGDTLDRYMESVMEKSIKSNRMIGKL